MRNRSLFHLRMRKIGRKSAAKQLAKLELEQARPALPGASVAALLLASAALERKLGTLPRGTLRQRPRLLAMRRLLRKELELAQGLMRTLFLPSPRMAYAAL